MDYCKCMEECAGTPRRRRLIMSKERKEKVKSRTRPHGSMLHRSRPHRSRTRNVMVRRM